MNVSFCLDLHSYYHSPRKISVLSVTRTTIVTVHPLRCHSVISSLLFAANKISLFTVNKPLLNVLPALSPNGFGAPRADAAIPVAW
jgi:hypothetical protein